MNAGDDWQDLMQHWQAQPVELPALRRATRWKTWRMRLVLGSEVAMCVFLLLFTWWAWDRPDSTDMHRYWLAFWCALVPVYLWISVAWRRGLWRPSTDSVTGLLRLRLARAKAAVRLGRYSIALMLFGAIAVVIWIGLFDQLYPAADAAIVASRRLALWGSIGWFGLWAVLSWIYQDRMRREQLRVEAMLAEFEEPGAD